ncbi:MAG TPA: site-2 protease family protein [Kofleriaceae bacterium]|nr:site-2 protease family protein [Kofleriaceae bacterium]
MSARMPPPQPSPRERDAAGELADDRGFPLGRVAGVRLVADWSLLVIFGLIVLNLGIGVLPSWHPGWSAPLTWAVAVLAAILFFGSVAVHELSHALVARRYDIPVRRITLFVFGGMAQIEREPPSPRAELWMAIVGPITSLVIGFAATFLGVLLAGGPADTAAADPSGFFRALGPFATLLVWLGPINIMLGVFNLVPGFPLDGGRVLRAILWGATGDLRRATRWASWAGQAVGWTLMAIGVTMLFGVWYPFFGGGPVSGLWLILIGWFLNNAARASYTQLMVREALEGIAVEELMRADPVVVPPDLTLDELIRDRYLHTGQREFPVVDHGGHLLGQVNVGVARTIAREQWGHRTVVEIMTPAAQLHPMRPGDPAISAMPLLAEHDPIPVVAGDHVLGVIHSQDLMRWLAVHPEAQPRA